MPGIYLNIISYKKNLYTYFFGVLLWTLILYWLFIIFYAIFRHQNYREMFIIGLIWLIIVVIISIIKKPYYILGRLFIDKDMIEIDFLKRKYLLSDIRDLTIELDGYRLQPHVVGRVITFSNGINNKISFYANREKHIYSFIISNKTEFLTIKKFINSFEGQIFH